MQYLLIRNARLPESPDGQTVSVLAADGSIIGIGSDIQHPMTDTVEIDAKGCYVMPALLRLCDHRATHIEGDDLREKNFDNATAGITTVMTPASNVEDTINAYSQTSVPQLNYAFHYPLLELSLSDNKRVRRVMVQHGTSTAIVRLGEERLSDVGSLSQHINAARVMGLRVLYDLRGLVDPIERMQVLRDILNIVTSEKGNKAYFVGIEYECEFEIVSQCLDKCDMRVHLSMAPFATEGEGKVRPETAVKALRSDCRISLGLAYSATKAIRERWPDMTPEIISRNKLPLLNAMNIAEPLTPAELAEFAMTRPAKFVGLNPELGSVCAGSTANLIVWDHEAVDDARFPVPSGDVRDVRLRGRVDYVIMNGKVVVSDKFKPLAVCGRHFYARLVD